VGCQSSSLCVVGTPHYKTRWTHPGRGRLVGSGIVVIVVVEVVVAMQKKKLCHSGE
jgi:hypothetical protein